MLMDENIDFRGDRVHTDHNWCTRIEAEVARRHSSEPSADVSLCKASPQTINDEVTKS